MRKCETRTHVGGICFDLPWQELRHAGSWVLHAKRTHAHTHTRTHTHTHTHTHTNTHTHTHTRAHTHTHTTTHARARTHARTRARTHANTHEGTHATATARKRTELAAPKLISHRRARFADIHGSTRARTCAIVTDTHMSALFALTCRGKS